MLDDFLHQVIFVQTGTHTDEKDRKIPLVAEQSLEFSCIPSRFHHSSQEYEVFDNRGLIPRWQTLFNVSFHMPQVTFTSHSST